jgi:alkanesulfonate monooxygenase SsuD/methylene tetrahydromethanopterin reductase-like flavin-dependent oxidoreductase (luciferase family)
MVLGRREALGLASVMRRALAVVHGLFLRAVAHAFSFDIRGFALDEGRVKPSPEQRSRTPVPDHEVVRLAN